MMFYPVLFYGQDSIPVVHKMEPILLPDTIVHDADSIDNETFPETEVADSLITQKAAYKSVSQIDTTMRISYWHITERTGEIYQILPDTFLTDYFNRTNVEGKGVSVAYLGNLGLPAESRVFFEREDRSEFMFADPYWAYARQPDKFNFTNTKSPVSTMSYQSAGSRQNKEERLQAFLTMNFGRKLNVGFDMDYLYARGFYNSQAARHMEWVLFGNYLSDRHNFHLFINPAEYINGENGGLDDDNWITHPEYLNGLNASTKEYTTHFGSTWNKLKGNRVYLNYHYNLGFQRATGEKDEDGADIEQFIPVSSIIYTADYTNRSKRFYTEDDEALNAYYNHVDFLSPLRTNTTPNDSTSYHSFRNTLGLSLREGFSEWAKFDLTAFVTQDSKKFYLMDTTLQTVPDAILFNDYARNQNSTYIGGELAKKTGKILRYNAQGSMGVVGYNIGDINISGNIETRIPLFNDTASVSAKGYIKNLSPTFYENHYHSQFFRWSNKFDKIRKVHVGGNINLPQTGTGLGVELENVTHYIYFNEAGYPTQYSGNIQVFAASVQQNFKLSAFHWDNQVVYQKSGEPGILPLPDICAYSSLFAEIVIAKVLTVQAGVNAHYWTKYYSPIYEPATQQFKIQHEIEVGEFPLICGFLNCHLKQTRFFVEYYNLGTMFINPPNYFSMPHYPVNPPGLRFGLSVDFHN
jgi:hypothetical protein